MDPYSVTHLFFFRFGRMLSPFEVAEAAIDGALRDEHMVTIPQTMKTQLKIGV